MHHHLLPPVYSKMRWMRAPAMRGIIGISNLLRPKMMSTFMIPMTRDSIRTVVIGLVI